MLGNFAYHNPTKLYFGDESLEFLNKELPNYGENVVLVYGGGSIKKNGVYQDILDILQKMVRRSLKFPGLCPIRRLKSYTKVLKLPAAIRRISSWPSAAVLSVTTRRP